MRRAEGALGGQRAAVPTTGDAVDPRDLERLLERGRRQDAREPARHHRLAGARRAHHQQVVPARRGDLERPLRVRLAADVGEVRSIAPAWQRRAGARVRARDSSGRAGGPRCWLERADAEHLHPARERRLRPRSPRARSSARIRARERPAPPRACRGPAAAPRRATTPRRPPSPSSASAGTWPLAASTPTAIARSNAGPALRTAAGARLAVRRCWGKSRSELSSAARTRSRASRTDASGRPTSENAGRPRRTSTSTVTSRPSTPSTANVATLASMGGTLGRRDRTVWARCCTDSATGARAVPSPNRHARQPTRHTARPSVPGCGQQAADQDPRRTPRSARGTPRARAPRARRLRGCWSATTARGAGEIDVIAFGHGARWSSAR